MTGIINALRDPIWQGIAGLIAIFTFVFLILDRYKLVDEKKVIYRIFSILRFSLSGIFLGAPLMALGGIAYWICFLLFGPEIQVQGSFGAFLTELTNIRFLWFGFASSAPMLLKQLNAFGLYFGSAFGLVFTTLLGFSKNFQWEAINPKLVEVISASFYISIGLLVFVTIVVLVF